MMLLMMLFWVAVVGGLLWVLLRASPGGWGRGTPLPRESPEEILRARYARGEIDRETYQRMTDDLRAKATTGS
jgi:putative membrane protein